MAQRGPGGRQPLPSLQAILGEVRVERESQLKHADALDAKAGILLGFAGVLVALTPRETNVIVNAGRVLAVIAAVAALLAFWPRSFPITRVRVLRDKYLRAEEAFTLLRIVDTHIDMVERTANALVSKATRLKVSMFSLAVAAALIAFGLVVT